MRLLFLVCVLLVLFSCPEGPLFTRALAQNVSSASSIDDELLADYQLDQLQAKLEKLPAGYDWDYLAGLLANRRGQDARSIELLNHALPPLRAARDPRASIALKTLADDYTKTFDYGAASKAYDDLFALFPDENRGGTSDDAALLHLLIGVKPMTVDWHGPTHLKTAWNAIGSRSTELIVNGVKGQWILDTGANYSVVSKSFARELGLTILPGTAKTGSGLTGLENSLQAGIIASVQVGGATVHNVVVLVLDDFNLNVRMGDRSFQIKAILGYPVFRVMQAITFTRGGEFEAGDAARRTGRGVPMYMRRLVPVVKLGVNGVALPFTLDTGSNRTDLSVRYYERFKNANLSWKQEQDESAGAGGTVKRTIYTQPVVRLEAGDEAAILKDVPIAASKTNSGLDELYGNLGQNMFDEFESFTLDFANMTFKLGAPAAQTASR